MEGFFFIQETQSYIKEIWAELDVITLSKTSQPQEYKDHVF